MAYKKCINKENAQSLNQIQNKVINRSMCIKKKKQFNTILMPASVSTFKNYYNSSCKQVIAKQYFS